MPRSWSTGRGGERTLTVENLFAGYYETVLARDELIAELRIPAQGTRRAAYIKCTTGSADDWPALGVAVSLEADGNAMRNRACRGQRRDREGDPPQRRGSSARAAPRIDDAVLAQAGDAAADEAETMSDVRGSAPYKRELLRVYVRRAVRQALDGPASRAS